MIACHDSTGLVRILICIDRDRLCNHSPLLAFQSVIQHRTVIGGSHTVGLVLPRQTAFKHIFQQNALIFGKRNKRDIRPVTAFAVLRRNKRGVYHNRLYAESLADLVLDVLVNGVVVLI